jgi:hypothetical protein
MPAHWPLSRTTCAQRRAAIARGRYEKGYYTYSATKWTMAVAVLPDICPRAGPMPVVSRS